MTTLSTQPSLYPPADEKAEWYADTYPGIDMGGVEKVLLHTTEGAGWPTYKDGSVAPNLTFNCAQRAWRQHFPLRRSARALCDPATTGVRENRDKVVQVEIVAVCDPKLAARSKQMVPVEKISDGALHDLGDFLAFMHTNFGVPLVAAPKWLPYPASAGDSPVRMSGPQYDAFKGILGHQHASGNVHGDPGSLDVATIIRYANQSLIRLETGGQATPAAAAALVKPTTPVETVGMADSYRYLRTPDGRYWGTCGLQCTHLETAPLRQEFLAVAGLKDQDVKDVSYDFMAQLQRIT